MVRFIELSAGQTRPEMVRDLYAAGAGLDDLAAMTDVEVREAWQRMKEPKDKLDGAGR
jgi:hypothetical protein